MVNYITPYSRIRNSLNINSSNNEVVATIKFDDLEKIIRTFLLSINVDEIWYRISYPDIDKAIRAGTIESAREHFIRDGYFEGRLPFAMTVDENWYLSTYEDIRSAVADGIFLSAEEHFVSHGYEEGRVPCKLI